MRLILLIISISFFTSCKNQNNFSLTYNTPSNEDIFIYKFKNNQPYKVDSSKNAQNHYFEIDAPLPELCLIGSSLNESLLFIAENKLQNSITKKNNDYPFSVSVKGDTTNAILQSYFDQKNQLLSILKNLDDNSIGSREKTTEMLANHKKFVKDFINTHKESPAILMLLGEVTNPLEFKKELLIIKEVVEKTYKNNLFLAEVNKIIESGKKQQQFIEQQQMMAKQQEKQKKALGIEIGAKAPNIKLKDPNGRLVQLNNLKGNIVLLDFWASWCKPCRAENPNIVRLYNKYKSKKFTVYSVSMDKDKQKWLEAIKQDQLSWENHVSELQGWNSSAGEKYGVSSIPSTFLINKKGEICGYNLRGEQLEKKIIELLSS
mgnify:CR=1 FL=1|tara:strand:- start:239 stop:1363 length:1125 start_codon:yes stop_codon:yes gene_type:complete